MFDFYFPSIFIFNTYSLKAIWNWYKNCFFYFVWWSKIFKCDRKAKPEYIHKGTTTTVNKSNKFLVKNIQNKWLVSFSVLFSSSEWLKVRYNIDGTAGLQKWLKCLNSIKLLSHFLSTKFSKALLVLDKQDPKVVLASQGSPPLKKRWKDDL